MTKRRIIWAIALLLTILLFYTWIPVGTYSQAPFIFSLIGAALFTFFLVQLIGDFRSWEEFNNKDKRFQDWRHKIAPFMVLPGIVMIFVFAMHAGSNETDELKKFGRTTKGYVKDGSGFKLRRGSSYDITIDFKDENGRWLTVKKDVTESEFNSYSKGQEITLVYSTKHPNIIEILRTDEQIAEYTGVKTRDIEIKDLTAILDMKRDSVNSFLNTISYQWTKHDSGWVNEREFKYVSVSPKTGTLTYICSFMDAARFKKAFKDANYQMIDSLDDKGSKVFYNDSIIASVELLHSKTSTILASVSMRKKKETLAEVHDKSKDLSKKH